MTPFASIGAKLRLSACPRKIAWVALWIVTALVFIQDTTGIFRGRHIELKVGQQSSQIAEVFQLRPSKPLPLEGRSQKRVQVWQDGERLRGPYPFVSSLASAGAGSFTPGRSLWALPYAHGGIDPKDSVFVARVPTEVPPWLAWPLYLAVAGFCLLPWTRRYYLTHPPSSGKVAYLESVRGLACLIVVSAHFCHVFLPSEQASISDATSAWDFARLHQQIPPLRLLTAGAYAVDVFFVLSGFVLTLPFLGRWQGADERLREAILRRPIRLYGLVLATVVLAHLTFASGIAYGGYYTPPQPFPAFLNDLLHLYSTSTSYVPVFWTIQYELWGAFGVYLFLWIVGGSWWRWPGYLIAYVLFLGQLYHGFLFGVILADLWRTHLSVRQPRWAPRLAPFLLVLGLFFGTFAPTPERHGGYDAWLTARLGNPDPWIGGGYLMLGAVLTLASILLSPRLQQWLSHHRLVAIGRLSYAIYAFHGLVLITIVCQLFSVLQPDAAVGRFLFRFDGPAYLFHLALVGVVYLVLTFAGAAWLTAAVDEPSVRLSHRFGKWFARAGEPRGTAGRPSAEGPHASPTIAALASPPQGPLRPPPP